MSLGLQIPSFEFPGVPTDKLFDRVADIARTAEAAGFDSVWVMDHFEQITGDPNSPILEGYVVLAGIAARTERVNLGTLVTGVIHRNPAILAKMVTSLDVLSKGRAILGIGAAWNDNEQKAYGIEGASVKERMDRLEEATQICLAMFTEEAATFKGTYYQIENAHNSPRPVRPEGIPIMIGGGGEKRTLKLVAQYANICNTLGGDAATIRHKMDVLDAHCADVGRDPKDISRTSLQTLVIGKDPAEAARKGEQLRAAWHLDEERYRRLAIEGTPDDVRARIKELYDAGLDGVIVNMPEAYDLDTVALTGDALSGI
jgi:F420-dependent oxidoreductase-like protein